MQSNKAAAPDVIVVGGGVIGLAAGWRAARAGLKVMVLERGRPGGETSHVAAGMLAPISEARASERPVLELGLRSAAAYGEFVADLAAASGCDPGYLACGTLAVARDADEAEALELERELRERLGLAVRRLLPTAARRVEPALAPTIRLALEIPSDHAIDPRMLTAALVRALERAGGTLRSGIEVVEVSVSGDRVRGVVLAGGERASAERVVIAAGPWSDRIAGLPAAARVPIRPVKGEILRLHDSAGPGLLEHVLRTSAGYVVPRGDGRYVLGATMLEQGFDRGVTAGAVFELLRDAIELVPGFSELKIDELSAGLRPATPDGIPAIGLGAVAGLHWATGHHRGGVLLAPLTAELVVSALLGEPPSELHAAVAPTRFAPAPAMVAQ
jgi:glycine oxidase